MKLAVDLVCNDRSALIVGASGTTIDLNGHTIRCVSATTNHTSEGVDTSCQPCWSTPDCDGIGPEPDIGIATAGFRYVWIRSSKSGGKIADFDVGVRVTGGSRITIEGLVITASRRGNDRIDAYGITVTNQACDGTGRKAIRVRRTVIEHHQMGILARSANCGVYASNVARHNLSGEADARGFDVAGSNNLFSANTAFDNGEVEFSGDGGLYVTGNANYLFRNRMGPSPGQAIVVVGSLNRVFANEVKGHDSWSPMTVQGNQNKIWSNYIHDNEGGEGTGPAPRYSAFRVLGADNRVSQNKSLRNTGDGLYVAGGGNRITNNRLLENGPAGVDAAGGSASDFWHRNNICRTQTTPIPPRGVCNPGEG